MAKLDVYLEVGNKKVFAGAVNWPGWCRSGRDEQSALQTLLEYGPRFSKVLQPGNFDFNVPTDVSEMEVVERLEGNATTDFGAPDVALSSDAQPIDETELLRLQLLLRACWQAFDGEVQTAAGEELRTGPRGGGRTVKRMSEHVLGADTAYLARLAWKKPKSELGSLQEQLQETREAILAALESAAHNGLPESGPRGGKLWLPRFFVRRVAWHVLDHAWEIEDRIIN